MFSRTLRFLRRCKPLIATSILTFSYGLKKVAFEDISIERIEADMAKKYGQQQMLKKIKEKYVCQSKNIREGELYFFDVTEQRQDDVPNKTYKVAIGRVKGKLYAVLGHCPYKQPLSDQTTQSNVLLDSIIFNQKLYCPHHGCAFDIRTGTVQYGPSTQNLSRLFVQQKQGKVYLYHPIIIPISVTPKTQFRDLNDLRKVVIIGGDHNATMGIIHGLKQYDYGGQLTVISNQSQYQYPYRQDLLHKNFINLNKNKKIWKPFKDGIVQQQLQQKLYSKLNFYDQIWYQAYGIDFVFNPQMFRVINKRYYPYVKFAQGTKVQFDGIVYATGFLPRFPKIKDITVLNQKQQLQQGLKLPINIFAPFYNKKQHIRLQRFLHKNQVKKMLVFGMNVQSLQFVQAISRQFPTINIKVVDLNKQNSLTQLYGPDIGNQIIKQYTKRGIQFYIKIQQIPQFKNKFSLQSITYHTNKNIPLTPQNSISVKFDQKLTLIGDCMILFSNNTIGNTERIKTAKYVDIDYNKIDNRIIVDPSSRTDTKRMFAAGTCSNIQFFFTHSKIGLINPNMAYQQGMTAAFNLNALNIPFHYIPFQKHKFFDKKLLYAGIRKQFNSMYIMGDINTWDFIAFYGIDNQIQAVCASPSRQKQFQVIRQAFRLQCQPNLQNLIKGQWNIPLIYKLIRKLDKSGCYKDLIQTLHPQMNIPDVIWMDRQKGSYVTNSAEDQDDQNNTQYDPRGYVAQTGS